MATYKFPKFALPKAACDLAAAIDELRQHYQNPALRFTLDGKLVGDVAEAVAAELFDIKLTHNNTRNIDATVCGGPLKGKTVQIKASGTGRAPAYGVGKGGADYLIFFHLDFRDGFGEAIYNGPEKGALKLRLAGLRTLAGQIEAADKVPLRSKT